MLIKNRGERTGKQIESNGGIGDGETGSKRHCPKHATREGERNARCV